MDNFTGNTLKLSHGIRSLLNWAAVVLLALSLIYSLLYVAALLDASFFVLNHRSMNQYIVGSVLFSSDIDGLVWGSSVVLFSVWLVLSVYSRRCSVRYGLWLVPFTLALVGLVGFGWFGLLPLALASFVMVGLCVVCSGYCFGVSRVGAIKRLAVGMMLFGVFVEVAALVLFNFPVLLNLPVETSAVALHWRLVQLSLSNLLQPFLPYGYLIFIVLGVAAFSVKVLSTTNMFRRWKSGWFFRGVERLGSAFITLKEEGYEPFGARTPLLVMVLVSIAVSSFFVVITVLPWGNPTYRLVSVDAPWYYQRVTDMRALDVNAAVTLALGTDRPVFLGFLTVLSYIVPLSHLVQFFPALLIPLFCAVSVLALRLFCRLREALVYTALLTPFSITALGLLYSGYFANMFALILVYFYFILLMKAFRSGSSFGLFGLLGVSVLILFTHLGTWFVFAASLVGFIIVEWRLAAKNTRLWERFKWKASIVGATVGVGLICDFVRQMLVSWSTTSFVSSMVSSSFGFPNGAVVLSGIQRTTDFHLGGSFANAPFIFLSVVGLLFMLSFKSELSHLLISWIFVSCVYMLFASGSYDVYVFNRFLFMMPTLVVSGLGLSLVVRFASGSKSERFRQIWPELLILVFIFLVLLNYSLNYVMNINA